MRMELNVAAIPSEAPADFHFDEFLKLIDESGLDYRLAPTGIQIEGSWEQLVDVAHRCHRAMREQAAHVVTTLKIEDFGELPARLEGTIAPVEARAIRTTRE